MTLQVVNPAASCLLDLAEEFSAGEMSRNERRALLDELRAHLGKMQSHDLAKLFFLSAVAAVACEFLVDAEWLSRQSGKDSSPMVVTDVFSSSALAPVGFLQKVWVGLNPGELKLLRRLFTEAAETCMQQAAARNGDAQHEVARASLDLISQVVLLASKVESPVEDFARTMPRISLDRAFDALDTLFGLDYERDREMPVKLAVTERLYEGAGVGVQSTYTSILIGLDFVDPAPQTTFVDLGAGYGRVALVAGLMRPDLHVIGYEYVPHRVAIAQQSAQRLAIDEHVRFFAQDLAAESFQIPAANTYYIYDSFSQATYRHVFQRLNDVAESRPKAQSVVLVTKGNATEYFAKSPWASNWSEAVRLDEGSLGVFRSK